MNLHLSFMGNFIVHSFFCLTSSFSRAMSKNSKDMQKKMKIYDIFHLFLNIFPYYAKMKQLKKKLKIALNSSWKVDVNSSKIFFIGSIFEGFTIFYMISAFNDHMPPPCKNGKIDFFQKAPLGWFYFWPIKYPWHL